MNLSHLFSLFLLLLARSMYSITIKQKKTKFFFRHLLFELPFIFVWCRTVHVFQCIFVSMFDSCFARFTMHIYAVCDMNKTNWERLHYEKVNVHTHWDAEARRIIHAPVFFLFRRLHKETSNSRKKISMLNDESIFFSISIPLFFLSVS